MRHGSAALLLASAIGTPYLQAQGTRTAVTLGPDAAAWRVGPYQGQIEAAAIDGDGRRAWAIGPNGLVVTSAAPIAKDTEVVARFRITLPAGQGRGRTVVARRRKDTGSA